MFEMAEVFLCAAPFRAHHYRSAAHSPFLQQRLRANRGALTQKRGFACAREHLSAPQSAAYGRKPMATCCRKRQLFSLRLLRGGCAAAPLRVTQKDSYPPVIPSLSRDLYENIDNICIEILRLHFVPLRMTEKIVKPYCLERREGSPPFRAGGWKNIRCTAVPRRVRQSVFVL